MVGVKESFVFDRQGEGSRLLQVYIAANSYRRGFTQAVVKIYSQVEIIFAVFDGILLAIN